MTSPRARYLSLLLLLCTGNLRAAEPLAAAIALVEARRYPEARDLLEPMVAADPKNAAAVHYLGRVIVARNDPTALEEGVKHLAAAVQLEPNRAGYQAAYGAAALQLAGRSNSLSYATKGRDALEKAVALDPKNLNAREGLFHFYQRAPWPIGSSAKAGAQLDAIRQLSPDLATVLSVTTKVTAKDYTAAFTLCGDVLARDPANYTALYHYGRTASICGQNLEQGLVHLQTCLTLTPPTPASPTHSHTWQRIGNLRERLQQWDEARAAYETALKIDPSNRQASDALAKLPAKS
ncbi:tetratricopeptide repeat protein [Horticoccus sp. 23ND18S-11]|uniref:tetratricopeptide repeat protein n=1 Tax=Horticoccus sp. 23ND18S-11 TaxID=3391832 RepID=UPI0039C97823